MLMPYQSELDQFRIQLRAGLIGGLAISLLAFWVFGSYFRIDVPASLMFQADDGWCEVPSESIGVHCFGDFNERVGLPDDHPWKNYVETSPVGPLVTQVANLILRLTSARFVLIAFLLLLGFVAILPIAATRTRSNSELLSNFFLFGIGTYPFLVLMDRGHSLAIASPLMFVYLRSAMTRNYKSLLVSIVALSCLKPVFIGLSLIFLIFNQPRKFVKALVLSIALPLVLLVVTGDGGVSRIREWLEISKSYTTAFRSVDQVNPPNASVGAAIYNLADLVFNLFETININWDPRPLMIRVAAIVALLLAGLIVLLLYRARGKTPPILSALILLIVFSLYFGEYVAPYYLVFVIPLTAVLHIPNLELNWSLSARPIVRRLLLSALVCTTSPLIIPIIPDNWFGLQSAGGPLVVRTLNVPLAVLMWILFCFATLSVDLKRAD